jgi:hypothetical protein
VERPRLFDGVGLRETNFIDSVPEIPDDLEKDRRDAAKLAGKGHSPIIDKKFSGMCGLHQKLMMEN